MLQIFCGLLLSLSLNAESVTGSANDVLSFREAPPARGPASTAPETASTTENELPEDQTEAGFCEFCGRGNNLKAKSLAVQSREILEKAEGRRK